MSIDIWAWLKVLRLQTCIFASLLVIAGFVLAKADVLWVVVIAVFFITSVTMLQNDYRDRFHDVQKGKVLAYKNQKTFLGLLGIFWITSISLIIFVAINNPKFGIVLTAFAIIGATYSEIRMIPFIPITVVSLTSASLVIIPFVNDSNPKKLWLLFLSVLFVIFAREIMKDLDDKEIDKGYKWTIPLKFGERNSRILATIAILISLSIATMIMPMIILAAPFVFIAIVKLFHNAGTHIDKKYLDLSIAITLFIFIIFG